MDKYLEQKARELAKSMYKKLKKKTKKDVVEDLFDSNNQAETNVDEVAPGKGAAMKLSEKMQKKQGVPKEADPAVHERCVKKVKAKGHDKSSAYAICNEAGAGQNKKSENFVEQLIDNFKTISTAYLKKMEPKLPSEKDLEYPNSTNKKRSLAISPKEMKEFPYPKTEEQRKEADAEEKKAIKDAAEKAKIRNEAGAGMDKKEGRCWEGYKPTPGKKPYSEGSCQKKSEGSEKPFHGYNKNKHSVKGGLSKKGREKINRETGSNLKAPVTSKAAKKSPKKAARRKSFCARMSGVKGPTSKKGKLTPKGAALKRWDC